MSSSSSASSTSSTSSMSSLHLFPAAVKKRRQPYVPKLQGGTIPVHHLTYKCNIDGIGYELRAFVQITDRRNSQCARNFWGNVAIINTDHADCLLATVRGNEVSRITRQVNSKSRVPAWVKEFLRRPDNYKGNAGEHGGDEDEITDLQKMCQIIYGPRGHPKKGLRAKHKWILRTKMLHFIQSFWLEAEWRGKGLAEHALWAYFNLLHQVLKYNGPILLTPAPLTNETLKMRKAKKRVHSWSGSVKRIEKMYVKAGLETIHETKEAANGITIMMRPDTTTPEQPAVLESQKPVNPHQTTTVKEMMTRMSSG